MKPNFLKTDKRESWRSWWFRTGMNWYPMYFGTGGKILFWSGNNTEVHLRLRLNIWTYNYVGTIFGGSMFAASDPFYMVMLLRILGPSYVVWDKSASIQFKRPARSTLYTKLVITEENLREIRQRVSDHGHVVHIFVIQWMDDQGVVHAEAERHCYIASKEFYQKRKGLSQSAKLEIKVNRK
jgi:acyl-coenzyme A thioesterase PaaI-like protein